MINLGEIEEAIYPTEWCCPIVVAMKSQGRIRICSDMTTLNEAVKCEMYPMSTVEVSLSKIYRQIFSKLDAYSGLKIESFTEMFCNQICRCIFADL